MIGINLSGAEFGGSGTRYNYDYHYPSASELAYYASAGVQLIRLPVKWERLQPSLDGPLSSTELARLKTFLSDANALGLKVIVDVHNYGRYAGNVIGSASVSAQQFADFWSKMATELKGSPALVGYDLMNEPHDMGGAGIWKGAAQAAVDAIRKVDMNTTIYVEGEGWSAAHTWQKYNSGLIINDPANKLIYEAHQYFDKNNTGTYANSYDADGTYANIGVDRLKPFADWLAGNNLKGFIGEFGVPSDDARWLEVESRFVQAMESYGLSGTAWGGGFWWSSSYKLRLGGGSTGDSASFDLLKTYINHIDQISGTGLDDQIQGTSLADKILAGDGSDLILGSAGADSIDGGAGDDTVSYAKSAAAVNVDLMRSAQLGGDADGDVLTAVEHLVGSALADTLSGDGGVNSLSGGDGNDILSGRGGADLLNGGAGTDTASYGDSTAGVDIDLLRSVQLGGDAQGDALTAIEKIVGSGLSDRLQGSALADTLIGGAGDDLLNGRGGADRLEGGIGTDRVSYADSAAGVDVDLTRASQLYGDAAGDTLLSIENVTGSALNDKLSGDALANVLDGGNGADVLNGRGGADWLTGGAGNDRFVFDSLANAKGDHVTDFSVGDILDLSGIDAKSGKSGNQAFTFIGTKGFTGSSGQLHIVYDNSGHTLIQGDVNGDKVADFTITLDGVQSFSGGFGLVL
jgi:aryl-phospho-beta-D-glucosidase BglC (GH1 family)